MNRSLYYLIILLAITKASYQACTTGQYSTGGGTCGTCNITCTTCTSSTASSCLTCDATRTIQTSSTCQCNDGYVENSPLTASCSMLSCSYTCLTCNNTAAACTTCNATKKRVYVSSNNTCPCLNKYYDNGVALCVACSYTCATCSSNSATSCLTCNATASRTLATNACNCMSAYYDNATSTQQCSACNYKCLTCSTSATNCLTCGNFRSSAPTCACLSGYYDDAVTNPCIICNSFCLTCTNGTNCLTCDSSQFRLFSTIDPICICMNRYYSTGVALCSSCDARCYTCSSASVCLTCNSTAFRDFSSSSNFCPCRTGYYETSSTVQLCAICNSTCLTCITSSTNCLTCDSTLNRVLSGSSCACMAGYYQNSFLTCSSCDISCYTCVNGVSCSTCISATLQVINSSGLCSCNSTTYYNTTQSKCLSCSYVCGTCSVSSSTTCLSCLANSFRTYTANNSCPCDIRYFDNGASTVCLACDYTCNTCSTSSKTSCIDCNTLKQRYLVSSNNTCLCQTLFYDNGSSETCQPCQYTCLTCTNATQCLTCNSTNYRNYSSTTKLCPCNTYYFENSTLICNPCLYHCSTCNSLTICTACDSSKFRVMNSTTMLCICMNGYYDNNVSQTCLACLPQCSTCTNSSKCVTCSSAAFRMLSSTSLCPCIGRYYDNAGTCTACLYSCLTCLSSITCTSCNSSAFRTITALTSRCDCIASYYDDSMNELCLLCSYACLTCTSSLNHCTTCDSNLRLLVNNWCACNQHYYDNNSTMVCVSCYLACSTCTNATFCLTCNISNNRIFDSIVQLCICMDGYYSDGVNQKCLGCPYQCLTCTNSSSCLSCDALSFRNIPNNTCPCAEGYYDLGTSVTLCSKCQYTCYQCTNTSQCSICDAITNFRIYNTTSKVCSCIQKYFDDSVHETCLPCDYSCKTCQLNPTTCLTCSSNAFRYLQVTSCLCLQHYYSSLVQICSACHYSCSSCISSIACLTCNSSNHRIFAAISTYCVCSDGYYDDGYGNQHCKTCDSTCLTCLNNSTCSSCDGSKYRTLNSTVDALGSSSAFCRCMYSYYYLVSATSISCLACHHSCDLCTSSSESGCVYCHIANNRALSSLNQCLCHDGYYDDGVHLACISCHSACSTCFNKFITTCNSCVGGYYLLLATTTCYTVCPDYYYTDNKTCSSCSLRCLTCNSNTSCINCEDNSYLYSLKCYSSCPISTFPDGFNFICVNCLSGCLTCVSLHVCTSCSVGYYLDTVIGICFPCHKVCQSCVGAGQSQCLSCKAPLYYKDSTCFNLTCISQQYYIDPLVGCTSCSNLFNHSLTCNQQYAVTCQPTYILVNGSCLYCTAVSGYQINSQANCYQICGDGILISSQCDDGNVMNGDGCSSNCLIENGWLCSKTIMKPNSNCILSASIIMTQSNSNKVVGQNIILFDIVLSLPIKLQSQLFTLAIDNLSISQYSWSIQQNPVNYSLAALNITYATDIQGKSISMNYNSNRRLLSAVQQKFNQVAKIQEKQIAQIAKIQGRLLGEERLLSVVFSNSFLVNAFPPANYYPESTLSYYSGLQYYISLLSYVLLSLCLCLIPKKMHLHAISIIYIPIQIYIVYGVVLDSYTDWIRYSVINLRYAGLVGGVSFGQCCSTQSQYLQYTTETTKVAGIALLVLVVIWLLSLLITILRRRCATLISSSKQSLMQYYLLTANLVLNGNLTYAAMNGLYTYTAINNKVDLFNMALNIFLSIFHFIVVLFLWAITHQENIIDVHQDYSLIHRQRLTIQTTAEHHQIQHHVIEHHQIQHQDTQLEGVHSEKNSNQTVYDKELVIFNHEEEFQRHQSLQNQPEIIEIQTQKSESSEQNHNPSRVQFIKNTDNQQRSSQIMQGTNSKYQNNSDQKYLEDKILKFDYESLYKPYVPGTESNGQSKQYTQSKSKYFLPVLYSKIYLTAVLSSLMQTQPFALLIVLSTLELIYALFVVVIRPFHSTFTNFRLVLQALSFMFMNSVSGYYLWQSGNGIYFYLGQQILVITILGVLSMGVFCILIEHMLAWRRQVWSIIEPCLRNMRLLGAKKMHDITPIEPSSRRVEKIEVEVMEGTKRQRVDQEIDAFYARVLKKEAINKQYKRKRFIK